SDAFWLWKEESQGAWGVYDHGTGDVWNERPQVIAWLSRIHAVRIAGEVKANAYDHTTGALHLEASGTHEVYIPERLATTFAASCNGTPLAATRDGPTGLISVTCAGALDVTTGS